MANGLYKLGLVFLLVTNVGIFKCPHTKYPHMLLAQAAKDITIQNDSGYDMVLSCDDLAETITLPNQSVVYLLDPRQSPQHCYAAWSNGRVLHFIADKSSTGYDTNWDFVGSQTFLNNLQLNDSQANTW